MAYALPIKWSHGQPSVGQDRQSNHYSTPPAHEHLTIHKGLRRPAQKQTSVKTIKDRNSVARVTEETTPMIRCGGCLRTRSSAASSSSPTQLLLLRLLLPPPTDRHTRRTCCMEKSDSRAPRTMSACHKRPVRDRGTAATVSAVASDTPDDTGLQRSMGDLHR